MLLQRDPRTNFTEIILDLRRPPHRLKLQDIADRINVDLSTLKGWFYHAHEPHFEDGRALIALHQQLVKSCQGNQTHPNSVFQSVSRAHVAPSVHVDKEIAMAKPKSVRTPGIASQTEGRSDPDAAIEAAGKGAARRIPKPRAAVRASRVKGDPDRPGDAPVNAKREMSYADAEQALAARHELDALKSLTSPNDEQRLRMAGLEKTALQRSVLTEKGWVVPPNPMPPRGARV